jgi:hypothetical protein
VWKLRWKCRGRKPTIYINIELNCVHIVWKEQCVISNQTVFLTRPYTWDTHGLSQLCLFLLYSLFYIL